jgi:RNA-binding protein YlmH
LPLERSREIKRAKQFVDIVYHIEDVMVDVEKEMRNELLAGQESIKKAPVETPAISFT